MIEMTKQLKKLEVLARQQQLEIKDKNQKIL